MAAEKHVNGIEELFKTVEELSKSCKGGIYILFCGSKDAEGKSWCPDCVTAEPVVHEGAKSLSDADVFIHCNVGERTYWKDQSNPFRTHENLKLTGVPTLLKWGSPKRLVEEQCMDKNLVEMLFED